MNVSDHKTPVWVTNGLVSKALGKGETPKLKLESAWQWIAAVIISGDVSGHGVADATVGLMITEEHSEYFEERIEIPASAYRGKYPSLVMANEWVGRGASLPPDDLITLTHLHEPSVVYCLKKRYDQDIIYTSTGPILIALNPFKNLSRLYDDDMMRRYWKKGEKVDDMLELAPHVYGTADSAFRSMMQAMHVGGDMRTDQSILVSGESGAGKTVSTKHIMKYLATLSQRKAEHTKRRRAPSPGRGENTAPPKRAPRRLSKRISRTQSWQKGALIEEKILESNPILEAFGNARTVRNDNSSRFGKFIELQFKRTGSMIGASIDTYLLEKVRLIHVGPGERTFHVFYELLAAATVEERKSFFLEEYTARDFKMTSASGTFTRRDGASDSKLFDKLVTSMGTMGLDPTTQEDIFAVCVAFLHASNLTFEAITDDSSKVDESNPHLEPVLTLLGLEKEAFQAALCQFEIEAGNTSYTRQLNKELSAKGLDALVKATYGAMFSFIVQNINKKIDFKPKREDSLEMAKAAFIGVLDIFGFEYFEHNSFEQLCINYCNEALQQQFNLHIFKMEQEEYQREGIAWEFIEFPDNQDVIDLIDKRGSGIITLLTDQCRTPRGTDKLFAEAMYKTCGDHGRFEASDLQRAQCQFSIHHYAGLVVYEVDGFLEKNKDEIPRGATSLLESSSKPFVQLLGKINDVTLSAAAISSVTPSISKSGRAKRPTVGGQFQAQLTELRKRIDLTHPHYVRCLKPNHNLRADDFQNKMIADQLRYAGVLEAIRVSRVGYPQRYTHERLLKRYRFLSDDATGRGGDMEMAILLDTIAKMIWTAQNPKEAAPPDVLEVVGIQKGETKVFLRQAAFDCMESCRTQQLSVRATKIERVVRGFLARRWYLGTMEKIVLTQACIRRLIARKHLRGIREIKSATKIQSTFRRSIVERNFVMKRIVAVWSQKMQRGRTARAHCTELDQKRQEESAIVAHQHSSAIKIQNSYRGKVARDQLVVLKNQRKEAEKARGEQFTMEEQAIFKKLEQKQQKVAIAAVRAAAVARETAQSKERENEMLRKELAESNVLLKQSQALKMELMNVRAELDITRDELISVKLREEKANSRAEVLEAENQKLKQPMADGVTLNSTGGYKSVRFDRYSDLKQLDERMHGIALRTRQGKRDLQALVQSLAILK